MLEKDIILAKINNIKNCLKAIQSVVNSDLSNLSDFKVENVVVLNLQRACQSAIDMAQVTIAYKGLALPNSYKSAFHILDKANIISNEIAEKMGKMAGFRNIAVHDYVQINDEILKSIIKNHLDDFKVFYTAILKIYP